MHRQRVNDARKQRREERDRRMVDATSSPHANADRCEYGELLQSDVRDGRTVQRIRELGRRLGFSEQAIDQIVETCATSATAGVGE